MRIAIIGSGIAGMSAAWLLNKAHDITVYESAERPGGHSHTVPMPTSAGDVPVDTGFIVYNERNYPNLTALFRHFDVETEASRMSFGVSLDGGRFEYSGSEKYGTLFAQKSNLLRPAFHRMLADIMRFNSAARRYLRESADVEPLTIGRFLERGRYGEVFCNHYLLPMSAAIWSARPNDIRAFPARSFLQFFDNHGLLSLDDRPLWRSVKGGSTVYVERLTASFRDRLRLGCSAMRVSRQDDRVVVDDSKGQAESFDAVVLACHADQASSLIDGPTRAEEEVLGAFDYQSNEAFLHSDPNLMPKRRAVWSSWNYLASSTRTQDTKLSVTYWMNHLQRLETDRLTLVSLNPIEAPDEEHVIKTMSYDHPKFDQKALNAQSRLSEIQGRHRLWFAGAHWGYGFHEDGLLSGLQVAAGLGAAPPWWPNVQPFKRAVPYEELDVPIAVAGSD
ncbi:MAG: NAD(P)/FAD-dependent oxidoreductase [Geminicoccaceae bacterium]